MRKETFFVILMLGCTGIAQAAIPAAERQVLIDLYTSTDGANWSDQSNWRNAGDTDFNDPGTECSWYGITCYGAGETVTVGHIDLVGNSLSGSLPPQLGSFSNLTYLSVHYNQLSGSIPPELGNLSNLQFLHLGANSLSGNIPPELGNLSNLKVLDLRNNDLNGSIPPELGNLSSVIDLHLWLNQLSGSIPSELGNCSNLGTLWLSMNELTGVIPLELTNLPNLYDLDLGSNQLSGSIPPELGNLPSLRNVFFGSNGFSGSIPPELGNLSNLEWLYLYNNQLSGSIPAALGNLSNLQYLNLVSNQLSGSIPVEFANLTGLSTTHTDLGYNALWTDDPTLQAFLDSKDSNWDSTQTISPSNISVDSSTTSSFTLSWTAIPFVGESGHYEAAPRRVIFLDGFETGDTTLWAVVGTSVPLPAIYVTVDKVQNSLLVDGLEPGTEYQFVVRTVTEAHTNNQSRVISEDSAVITATTAAR